MISAEHTVMQEILRNPQAYGEETVREMRHKACEELARLWRMESRVRRVVEELADIATPKA
jgi:hypothetical protein